MSSYQAPLADIRFVLTELADFAQVVRLPGYSEAAPDVAAAVLEEAAKFAAQVLDPLDRPGDLDGARRRDDGGVSMPAGFKDAYRQFCENGWNGLGKNPEYGGQGLPRILSTAVEEMWHASNMAFSLCPMLTQGAIEAIELCGSQALKDRYLPNMVAGTWTGTMNLTEPQAGSDLAAVRTKAVPHGDGTYRIRGQKIFITYGEHDYTDNIVHLVLARTPDAPPGVKGISLFVVPKVLIDADGSPGAPNDVRCVSIERKLGIHASPTAVMAYGDHGGAVGHLVGEEGHGLAYMFVMMNLARFSIGIEGIGIAERAYQRAVAYARQRVQGKAVGSDPAAKAGAIIEHPDVRRMLMTMRAQVEAMRAVAYVTAAAMDQARRHPDAELRRRQQAFVDFMIPIIKGCATEAAQEVTSLGVQIHGGMGFIEESGAAQHFRDARITTIYEGTTGIQANDLIGRKTARDGGAVAKSVVADIRRVAAELAGQDDAGLRAIGARLADAAAALHAAIDWMVTAHAQDVRAAHASAVPYLRMWGLVTAGWQMGRAAMIAARRLRERSGDARFLEAKIASARFYAECFLPQAAAYGEIVIHGGNAVLALETASF